MAPYPPPPTALPTTSAQILDPPYPWIDRTVAIVCLAIAPTVLVLIWLFLRYQRKAKAAARAQNVPCHHGRDVDIRSRSPFRYTQDIIYIETNPRPAPRQSPTLTGATPPPETSDDMSPLSLPSPAPHARMQSMSTESCTSQTSMVTLYRQSNLDITPATLDDPFADFSAIHHEDDDDTNANPPTGILVVYNKSDSGIGEMRPDSGYYVSVGESEIYAESATPSLASLTPSFAALMQLTILSAEHMRIEAEDEVIEEWLATYADWSDEWVEETVEDWEAAERDTSDDGLERENDDSAGAADDADLYGAD